jgi:hypothetical protein
LTFLFAAITALSAAEALILAANKAYSATFFAAGFGALVTAFYAVVSACWAYSTAWDFVLTSLKAKLYALYNGTTAY